MPNTVETLSGKGLNVQYFMIADCVGELTVKKSCVVNRDGLTNCFLLAMKFTLNIGLHPGAYVLI